MFFHNPKMEDHNSTSSMEELRIIFNHCSPNKEGLISLKNLQALFAQQSNQVSLKKVPIYEKAILIYEYLLT